MEATIAGAVAWLLAALALPSVGLSAIFLVSLVSATLLPMGSEPAVYAYVMLTQLFWPTVLVATLGNTLGGAISYGMGRGAWQLVRAWDKAKAPPAGEPTEGLIAEPLPQPTGGRWHQVCVRWLERLGPRALFFAWLPAVGDPLCAVAGFMRFAFWPSVFYMAIGKFLRYALLTASLLWLYSGEAVLP